MPKYLDHLGTTEKDRYRINPIISIYDHINETNIELSSINLKSLDDEFNLKLNETLDNLRLTLNSHNINFVIDGD